MAHAFGYLSRGGAWRVAPRNARRTPALFGRIVLGLLLAFACQLVHAQGPAIQAMRFTVFSAKPIAEVAFTPRPNAGPQKLQFNPTSRSPRYEYRGTMPLRFVDATTGAVVAEANIPPNVRDALLLFSPLEPASGAGALRFQVSVLDDGAARHGPGGLAIINLSGLVLTGTVGAEKVALKPGLNPTLTINRAAKIILSTAFKNRTYQSYTGNVTLGRNERALLILFPPFYKGSLEVQSRLLLDQPPGASSPATAPIPEKSTRSRS